MALFNSKSSSHFQVQQPQPIQFLNFISWLSIFLFLLFPFANSISFSFSSFNPNDIQCQGDATINEDTGELQLTKCPLDGTSPTSSVGRATYSIPMQLWDPKTGNLEDFNTHFSFIIVPSNTNSPGGDGLSFFLSPQNATIPIDSTGGNLGLFDSSNPNDANNPIVAIEFDTYQNSWDQSPYHVGIDVNSIKSVVAVSLVDGSIANNVTANAWVVYDSTTKTLSVNLSYEDPNQQYYNVSYSPLDWKNVLPEWVRVGFSGATGSGEEKYNILSWSFNSTLGGSFDSTSGGSPSSSPSWGSPSDSTSGGSPSDSTSGGSPYVSTLGGSPSTNTDQKTNQPLVIYLPVGIGSLICGVGLVWFIQLKTSFLRLPSYSQVKNCFSGSRDQASLKAPHGSSSASYDQTKTYGSDQMIEEKEETEQRGSEQMVEEKEVTERRGSDQMVEEDEVTERRDFSHAGSEQMVEEKEVTERRGRSARAAPSHASKHNQPRPGSHAPVQSNNSGSILGGLRATIAQGTGFGIGSIVDDVAQGAGSAVDTVAQRAGGEKEVTEPRGSEQMVEEKEVTERRGSDQMVEEDEVTERRGSEQMVEEKEVTERRGRSARAAPRHSSKHNQPRPGSHAPVQSNSSGSILGGLRATIAQGTGFGIGSIVDDVAQGAGSAVDTVAQRAGGEKEVTEQRGRSARAAPRHASKHNQPPGMCFGTGSIVDVVVQRAESDVNAMEDRVDDDVAQSTESAIDDEAQRVESDVNVVEQRVVDAMP